jgi:hypothetical protein
MLKKWVYGVALVLALGTASYYANQDRQDATLDQAYMICARAYHSHHVVASTFDITKCMAWDKENHEDDDR